MTETQIDTGNDAKLQVLVLDDDRLSSHNLSIQLKFVGETPLLSTSTAWQGILGSSTGTGRIFAVALGQVRKVALAELLVALHRHDTALPLLLLYAPGEEVLAALPESLRQVLLLASGDSLNYESLLLALNQARQLAGYAPGSLSSSLISASGTALFRSLSGESARIRQVRQQLRQVAGRQASVLVMGESGTGKEIVARNLHYHSGRGDRPFIAVNCAAIAHDRNGIELFGQEAGYYEGSAERPGLFEQAEGGTLFFDEIGELPLSIQAMLLRFLEEKRFQRLGGHELRSADVRVVAGTRLNLEQRMREGRFREDLYFRLSVVPFELPPLRERVEDIPELVKELISSLENRDRTSVRFNSSALLSLRKHHWPGNVRELANLVERLGIMHPNAVLGVQDLPPQYQYPVEEERGGEAVVQEEVAREEVGAVAAPAEPEAGRESTSMPPLNEARLQQYLDNFERQLLETALEDSMGLVSFAAERLQVDASTLRAMLQAHGISETELKARK